jgi:Rrf2 family protein
VRDNAPVRISAKADYAVRAAVELAARSFPVAPDTGPTGAAGEPATQTAIRPTTAEDLARTQGIPHKFLESILSDLRRADLVASQRGVAGGYWLNRPAASISVADVIRAVDGPLATVRGERAQDLDYVGSAEALQPLWVALRASVRGVLENVTLADLARSRLPARVRKLAEDDDAWRNH